MGIDLRRHDKNGNSIAYIVGITALPLILLMTILGVNSNRSQANASVKTTKNSKFNMSVKLKVKSLSFKYAEMIPKKYTCQGENISPQIDISGVPLKAKSLAMITDDPDAPAKIWVHWVIFNIPANTKTLSEGMPTDKILKNGTIQGKNSSGSNGYEGPCPPSGVHRYFFKVYALDTKLKLSSDATKKDLLDAMNGHIIAKGQLMGKYIKD